MVIKLRYRVAVAGAIFPSLPLVRCILCIVSIAAHILAGCSLSTCTNVKASLCALYSLECRLWTCTRFAFSLHRQAQPCKYNIRICLCYKYENRRNPCKSPSDTRKLSISSEIHLAAESVDLYLPMLIGKNKLSICAARKRFVELVLLLPPL